jgi:hypothetical protein
MKFENTEVFNFEGALRGMRNPHESWNKSDSWVGCYHGDYGETDKQSCKNKCNSDCKFCFGENDLELAQKLVRAGSEHRKFMRQIFVSVDITAPLYWWKEFDTYKVGTVANSTSTMHKLASTPITMDCFEMDDFENLEDLEYPFAHVWEHTIKNCEILRQKYNETKDKRYWKELIRLLPESWLQKRTITMTYENVFYMYNQRCVHPHKLTEWSKTFKEWVETLPHAKELLCIPLEKK